MKSLITALTIVAGLALAGSAAAAITIDGIIDPGEGWSGYTFADPNDDRHVKNAMTSGVEMLRWGAKVEADPVSGLDYLYWCCEIDGGRYDYTDFQGEYLRIYPSLWIDVDCDDWTYVTDDGANPADVDKKEWGDDPAVGRNNHRGIDAVLEISLVGNWVNGLNQPNNGPGPNASCYNYWGTDPAMPDNLAGIDKVEPSDSDVQDGSWIVNGPVLEARVLLSEVEYVIRSVMADHTSTDNYVWYAAVAVQGSNKMDVDYGYDVGSPFPIGIDGDWIPGDINMDGAVSLLDLAILAANYDPNDPPMGIYPPCVKKGDVNYDGRVSLCDLSILAGHYGESFYSPPAAAPEPASLGLLALGVLGLLRRR